MLNYSLYRLIIILIVSILEGIMTKYRVGIVMGSDSDYPVVQKAETILKSLDIPYVVRVLSAHRTPAHACKFASEARENGFGVLIAAAGKAAHLAGVLAAHTTLPVIGIPIKSSTLDGLDSLLSTVQMPKGIPVATVAVDGSENAALLAAQILAVSDESIERKLYEMRKQMEQDVLAKDEEIRRITTNE
jgi:5-(carboxyamino)imidazole ribonucleotide mutase